MKLKRFFNWVTGITFISLLALSLQMKAQAPAASGLSPWWSVRAPGIQRYTKDAKKLPLISVKGNKFVNSTSDSILFKGLSISDPDRIASLGHWSRDHFVKVKEMGN